MTTSGEEREKAAVAPVLVIRKVKQILESFTIEEPELTLQQITRLTGLPSSTCQRLVQNLVREGFLDRYEDRYRIGLGLVQVAAPGTFGLDLVRLTRPALRRLRDETGETACLYMRDGAFRTVVALAESRHPVIRLFVVGMVMPLHAGSAGKVFMAWDPAARRDAVGQGLPRYTPRTVVDIDLLTEQLGQIRRAGYATSFEERDYGAASISAPVFGMTGDLVAAIGIGAPTQRLAPSDTGRLASAVVGAAEEASRRLGHRTGVRPDSAAL
ncbi:IclR family transcriptional regulator [Actinoallomurus bryophytorum]|uniref:IclR family transcriptional regulator n=1 Tax=Actinoallomurus bryophytorum TaxID=1490222 RepID=A0A543CEH0_9ACTN|nr:IclR family transcriptional regulator [Actinoallomurus bryophytorum]TQL95496.1 IclR family transcriptional regulator [Actinoallomurus bryophytorum]